MIKLSSQYKGTITELSVAAYILNLGYLVSQPLTQDSKYDLLIDKNGNFLRVQVKTARLSKNQNGESIKFNCRSTTNNVKECKNRRYTDADIDYFATFWKGIAYLIPVQECSTEKVLWITQPTQSACCYAAKYEASEVLKTL